MKLLNKKSFSFFTVLFILLILGICATMLNIGNLRIACVGDSITYGSKIKYRRFLAYPQRLNISLGYNGYVRNYGHSGATVLKNGNIPYWKQLKYKSSIEFQPHIVIILLGTNDAKEINWEDHKAEFKSDYIDLIRIYQALETKPLIIIGTPPPVFNPLAGGIIRKDFLENEIIPLIEKIADEESLLKVDFYNLLKEKPYMFPDHIHPNFKATKLMANEVKEVIENYY